MEGRMFKVSILLDNDKILRESVYPIKDIYYTIEKTYKDNGFIRDYDMPDGSMVFYGVNGWGDLRGLNKALHFLQSAAWFMRYVKKWSDYTNEKCDFVDGFCESDVLEMIRRHERTARAI
jgi:hypothetical protein